MTISVAACSEAAAPTRNPYACPQSAGEFALVGCARTEVFLTRPDGTPAAGVYLSARVVPTPLIFPNAYALPTDSDGRTRLMLDWEVLPLPYETSLYVEAIRLEPVKELVHHLDTALVIMRSVPAGERPETDTLRWQLKQW